LPFTELVVLREADDELELFDVLETVLFPCMPGPGGGIRLASSTELLDLVADGLIGATGKAERLRVDWNCFRVSYTQPAGAARHTQLRLTELKLPIFFAPLRERAKLALSDEPLDVLLFGAILRYYRVICSTPRSCHYDTELDGG
jgi:hypothetical protein